MPMTAISRVKRKIIKYKRLSIGDGRSSPISSFLLRSKVRKRTTSGVATTVRVCETRTTETGRPPSTGTVKVPKRTA